MYQFIAQALGILGAAFLIFSFQQKKSGMFFAFQSIGSGLFLINYLMLGASTGALISIMSVIRSSFTDKVKKPYTYVFCPLLLLIPLIISFYIYTGTETIFMISAYIIFTAAMFTKNSKIIRAAQLIFASPLQLAHNAMVASLGGVICEAFNLISILISLKTIGFKNFTNKEDAK